MEETKPQSLPIRFGIFEVDRQAGELRRHGFKVRLQDQPFQVLMLLLERPGEVVTREELQKKLWPSDTFVDFERGLNRAINKLREALADDADSPRFIETLPRRGYRFIAPVEPARTRKPEAIGASQIALVPVDRPEQVEDSVSPAPARAAILPWAIAGLLAVLVVIGFLKIWLTPAVEADRPFQQLNLDAGPGDFSQPAISSDGMHIVFVSQGRLAIRHLDQSQTSLIPGTEGACYPFFSPNGQWVGFFASGKLQKVAVAGGAPIPLCDAPSPGGGSWGADDRIVATLDGSRGLFRVPAAGGTPEPLTDPRDDPSRIVLHRWPQALPGGKGILFAAISASLQGSLRIVAPNGGTPRTLVENSTYGRFLASGYLVYRQRNELFAAPMDPERLVLTGPGVPLVYTVAISDGRADFDLSANGTLVYRRGTPRNSVPSWLYPSGNTEPAVAKRATYSCPRLSPDATRLAISVLEEGKQRLWVYDLGRETWSRLTSEGDAEFLPAWTPDGAFLAFRSGNTLAWTRSDGSGNVSRLAGVSANSGPWSFSADGKWLAFWPLQPGSDLWLASVERTPGELRLRQPRPLLQQKAAKGAPAISPDDRWVAYTSNETGQFEIYVIPFSPDGGTMTNRKWTVSNGGGHGPIWSRNGRELFYEGPDHRVHAAAYTVSGDSFAAEKPRLWSEEQMADIDFFPAFDVASDGKRVLALLPDETGKPETSLQVLLNVDSELRRRAFKPGK